MNHLNQVDSLLEIKTPTRMGIETKNNREYLLKNPTDKFSVFLISGIKHRNPDLDRTNVLLRKVIGRRNS